ncbi:MAG TPA: NAD(P)-binding domain-containing protein, partial [Chitinophagaceae bacterium]|nr:NAD(P)-binding domain-containing protein [Chitinophagaceae bacterium]
MQKKITIIGSGNTATVLGRLLKSVGYIIQGIYSRTPVHADSLAAELDAIQHGSFDNISQEADLFIIAVQDKAIATVAGMLQLPGKIVVHTSGSVPAGVLKQVSANYGVLYPLQSLRKEVLRIPEIPFLVFGANHHTRQQLFQLAKNISANVEYAGDEARLKLHL